MLESGLSHVIHTFVGWLLQPVIVALALTVALAVWESGLAVGERLRGLERLRASRDTRRIEHIGQRRIERADLLTRIGPMLGLMGTLIPLGPGLAALGRGEMQVLANAVTIAFDTTVMGLLAGIVGFVLGKLRRRWYDGLLTSMGD